MNNARKFFREKEQAKAMAFEVLKMFRKGNDTDAIARFFVMHEAEVLSLLEIARKQEQS